jgi:hypothetical protein
MVSVSRAHHLSHRINLCHGASSHHPHQELCTFLGLAPKPVQEADKSLRTIRGVERNTELLKGVVFKIEFRRLTVRRNSGG